VEFPRNFAGAFVEFGAVMGDEIFDE